MRRSRVRSPSSPPRIPNPARLAPTDRSQPSLERLALLVGVAPVLEHTSGLFRERLHAAFREVLCMRRDVIVGVRLPNGDVRRTLIPTDRAMRRRDEDDAVGTKQVPATAYHRHGVDQVLDDMRERNDVVGRVLGERDVEDIVLNVPVDSRATRRHLGRDVLRDGAAQGLSSFAVLHIHARPAPISRIATGSRVARRARPSMRVRQLVMYSMMPRTRSGSV